MSVPQQAKQYKIRGRQYRIKGDRLMRFHAGASTHRNNTVFHCNNRLPLLFIRDCLSPIVSFLSRHAVSWANSDTCYFVTHRSKALPEWHRIGRVTFMFARQTHCLTHPSLTLLISPTLLYQLNTSPYTVSGFLSSLRYAVWFYRTRKSVIIS